MQTTILKYGAEHADYEPECVWRTALLCGIAEGYITLYIII